MPSLIIYVLLTERTRQAAEQFLNHYLPFREAATVGYEYPQYEDNAANYYTNVGDLFEVLERDTYSTYSLYWNPISAEQKTIVQQAMLFFTVDAGLIGGLAVPEEMVHQIITDVQQVLNIRWAVVTGEETPPDSIRDFLVVCRTAKMPRIVDGELIDD